MAATGPICAVRPQDQKGTFPYLDLYNNSPICSPEKNEFTPSPSQDEGTYLIYKISKQVIFRGAFGIGYIPRTQQFYQNYFSQYQENSNQPMFTHDPASVIYNQQTGTGRTMAKMFLPPRFRGTNLTQEQQEILRSMWGTSARRSAVIGSIGQASRMLGDAAAMTNCLSNKGPCSLGTSAVTVLDFSTAGAALLSLDNERKGGGFIKQTLGMRDDIAAELEEDAFSAFKRGVQWRMAANGLQVIGGATKMAIEMHHAIDDPEQFKPSAMFDGIIDTGQGASWFAWNRYYMQEATKVLASEGVREGVDTLAVAAKPLPTSLLWTMRGFAVAGGVVSLCTNGYCVYNGIENNALSEHEKRKAIVSGSLGIASSLLFMGYGLSVTPASLPIGLLCYSGGSLLLVAQTLYDESDEMPQRQQTISSNGLPPPHPFHFPFDMGPDFDLAPQMQCENSCKDFSYTSKSMALMQWPNP